MPTVVLQLTIGDYAKWRPVFDKHNRCATKLASSIRMFTATLMTQEKSSSGTRPQT